MGDDHHRSELIRADPTKAIDRSIRLSWAFRDRYQDKHQCSPVDVRQDHFSIEEVPFARLITSIPQCYQSLYLMGYYQWLMKKGKKQGNQCFPRYLFMFQDICSLSILLFLLITSRFSSTPCEFQWRRPLCSCGLGEGSIWWQFHQGLSGIWQSSKRLLLKFLS